MSDNARKEPLSLPSLLPSDSPLIPQFRPRCLVRCSRPPRLPPAQRLLLSSAAGSAARTPRTLTLPPVPQLLLQQPVVPTSSSAAGAACSVSGPASAAGRTSAAPAPSCRARGTPERGGGRTKAVREPPMARAAITTAGESLQVGHGGSSRRHLRLRGCAHTAGTRSLYTPPPAAGATGNYTRRRRATLSATSRRATASSAGSAPAGFQRRCSRSGPPLSPGARTPSQEAGRSGARWPALSQSCSRKPKRQTREGGREGHQGAGLGWRE